MRTPLLIAALAAVLACSLAGCAASGPASTAGAASSAAPAASSATAASADAADLVGTTWRVAGAGGDSGATVAFQSGSIGLTAGSATSTFAWAAQGDQVLVTRSTLALAGGTAAAWLTATTRVARSGDGWRLLDAAGATTARLEPTATTSGTPSPTDPATAVPGPGVTDEPASALAGAWHLAGHPTTAITFTGGRWRAAASCETGASGGTGAYRVLPGGRLLVTRIASLMLGCPIGRDDDRVRAPAIAGIDRAGSFRIDGGTLTLYDRSGTAIGSLVR